MAPYSGQWWLASVAEWTPRIRRWPAVPGLLEGFVCVGPRRLADGEERQDAGGDNAVGRKVADVVDDDGVESGHGGQLGEPGGGLGEDAVHACRSVGVRGDLGDDKHFVGHGGECTSAARVGAAALPSARMRRGRGGWPLAVRRRAGTDEEVFDVSTTSMSPRRSQRSWRAWALPLLASRVVWQPTSGCVPPGRVRPWRPRPIQSAAHRETTWRCTWQ